AALIESRGLRRAFVDSIRNPAEVAALRGAFGDDFRLVGVVARLDVRFERLKARGRLGDALTREAFEAAELAEAANPDVANGQQLVRTLALADVLVENDDASVEAFAARAREALARRDSSSERREAAA